MRKYSAFICFFIALFFLPLLEFSQDKYPVFQEKYPGIKVIEKSHGLYEVEVSGKKKAEKTLTQSTSLLSKYKLLLTTDTIVSDIGKDFGVEFIIQTANKVILPVKLVWEYPKPMKNPYNGNTYKVSETDELIVTNQQFFYSYSLDYEYELVEGLWGFKVYYQNVEIYKHYFLVILPL